MSQTSIYLADQRRLDDSFCSTKEKIDALVPDLFTKEHFFDFLEFLYKWQHYSIYNVILIYKQYPTATYLASYNRWKELSLSYGNGPNYTILQPKYRKRGITLLIPFSRYRIEKGPNERFLSYKNVFVFDVSQTNNLSVPDVFTPYVAIKEMDFFIFLSVLLKAEEGRLRILPFETREEIAYFKEAKLLRDTILYNPLSELKKEDVFNAYIHYVTHHICQEKQFETYLETFIFQASRKCLFSYYELYFENPYEDHRLLSDLKTIKNKTPQQLLQLLHRILQVVKMCIYRINLGFKVQLTTNFDNLGEPLLLNIEGTIKKELTL